METEHQQFRAAWGYTYISFNERVLASFSWTRPSFPPRQHTRAASHQPGLLATWDTHTASMPRTQQERLLGSRPPTHHTAALYRSITDGNLLLLLCSIQVSPIWQFYPAYISWARWKKKTWTKQLKENHLWNKGNRPEGPISSTCIPTKLKAGFDREGRGLLTGGSVATTHTTSCWWPIPQGKTLQKRLNNWNRGITELINLEAIGYKVMEWAGGDRPSQQAERSFSKINLYPWTHIFPKGNHGVLSSLVWASPASARVGIIRKSPTSLNCAAAQQAKLHTGQQPTFFSKNTATLLT